MPGRTRALAWLRAERANLFTCVDGVTRADQYARVIALTASLAGLFRQDGPWTDSIARHTARCPIDFRQTLAELAAGGRDSARPADSTATPRRLRLEAAHAESRQRAGSQGATAAIEISFPVSLEATEAVLQTAGIPSVT